MALIVEDGTGLVDAESYASVAAADAYFSARGVSDWDTYDEAQKEAALRKATDYIERTYYRRWKGYRNVDGAALSWPRGEVYDSDDYLVCEDCVPTAVANACIVLARSALTEELLVDDDTGTIKREKVKVGPIENETEYVGGKPVQTRRLVADAMLQDLITNPISGLNAPVGRA